MNRATRGGSLSFLVFFTLAYISNVAATGCAYLFFYLSGSLRLLGASGAFIVLVLDISRLTMILALFISRSYSDRISKHILSAVLALCSLLAFLGLSGSQGMIPILLFCLMFGFSAFGPIVLASIVIDSLSPKNRLRYYAIFATSYSLSSIVASFFVQKMVHIWNIPVDGQAIGHLEIWKMVWPFDNWAQNPNAIFLLGTLLSGIWLLFIVILRRVQNRLPFYGTKAEEKKEVPSWRSYRPFILWAILLGVLWVCEMDLVTGYASSLGLFNGTAWFFSMFGLLAILSRLGVLPFLTPRYRLSAFFIGVGLYALSLGSLLILSTHTPTRLAMFLFGFSGATLGLVHGVLHTLLNILFVEQSPKHPGNATFAYMFVFNAGALISLSLKIWIDFLGYKGIFLGLFLFLFGVLLYSRKNEEWKRRLLGPSEI